MGNIPLVFVDDSWDAVNAKYFVSVYIDVNNLIISIAVLLSVLDRVWVNINDFLLQSFPRLIVLFKVAVFDYLVKRTKRGV